MKRVEAIIRPSKVEDVKGRLEKIGVQGITMTEVKGYGRQPSHTEVYRGAECPVDFVPKIMLTTVVNDDQVEGVVSAVMLMARTGAVGDGRIFICPIDDVVRIRTKEHGGAAL